MCHVEDEEIFMKIEKKEKSSCIGDDKVSKKELKLLLLQSH